MTALAQRTAFVIAAVLACGCAAPAPIAQHLLPAIEGGEYLYVWVGDADRRQTDFLAVLDARADSPTYGSVLTTVPIGSVRTYPHHTEHEAPARAEWPLFANGFAAGRTWLFDLSDPEAPRLVGEADTVGHLHHPHSFARLPDGHVIATLQGGHGAELMPGGLAEFDARGRLVRSASAADSTLGGDAGPVLPYSLIALPDIDRLIMTSADMHSRSPSRVVQLWRLSDLTLLRSIALADGPGGDEGVDPAEPRVLSDGGTVMVSTFSCGLYLLDGVESGELGARLVHTFEGGDCALPAIVEQFWIQTVPSAEALVVLDVSDPARPREVARLQMGDDARPHWLARDASGARLVVTGAGSLAQRVALVDVDTRTGALSLDSLFNDGTPGQPGISFARDEWPHGRNGAAEPHAVVFSRRLARFDAKADANDHRELP